MSKYILIINIEILFLSIPTIKKNNDIPSPLKLKKKSNICNGLFLKEILSLILTKSNIFKADSLDLQSILPWTPWDFRKFSSFLHWSPYKSTFFSSKSGVLSGISATFTLPPGIYIDIFNRGVTDFFWKKLTTILLECCIIDLLLDKFFRSNN